ncbi:Stress-induced-phosphoprotein 1 [Cyanidiococcus yangmingshanensis]|uniref:Stress-induced-phosphoprotein 1 n=1 Tax=Cyanidiococcus yangmingshanensis TaxID=2690220 RepID=A0A7J7ID93_9RHOD|nr:Stress-induced-phosphoprotein 1 [Cyanidiococcus yangmingshanensis]
MAETAPDADVALATQRKQQGNEAFAAKDFEAAVRYFTEAIELDPSNHVLYSNRSAAYASKGEYEEALADAERCIELAPQWSKGYSRRGAALVGLGELDEAAEAYRQGLSIDPENSALQRGLDEVERAKAQGAKTGTSASSSFQAELLRALASNPRARELLQDPSVLSAFGDLNDPSKLMDALRNPKIQEVFEIISGMREGNEQPASSPDSGTSARYTNQDVEQQVGPNGTMDTEPVVDNRGENTRSMDLGSPAPDADENIRTTAPADSEAEKATRLEAEHEKELGNDAYKRKQFDLALEHYRKAQELNPRELVYILNEAAVYFEMKDFHKTIELCQWIIDRNREENLGADFSLIAKAYARMANAYDHLGDFDAAIQAYEKSLVEHHDSRTIMKLQDCRRRKKKHDEEAYVDIEKSQKAREEGNTAFKAADFPKAIEWYTEAHRRNPLDPVPLSNRAAAYIKLGEIPSALRDVNKALELDSKFVRAYARKGQAHMLMKEYHKALDAYEKGLELDPNNAELREGYARVMVAIHSTENDPVRAERALADPEIQAILMDPQMNILLKNMESDPSAVQSAMRNPGIASKIRKLVAAGIIRTA